MDNFINVFILLPFLGLVILFFVNEKSENSISRLVIAFTSLNLIAITGFIIYWVVKGSPVLEHVDWILYRDAHNTFALELYFETISATFLALGAFIMLIISVYCRYYLHRDEGYKRFFITLLLFAFGFNFTTVAGNFETLFFGWEILGISSFLLIAFYRERYLPVRNALRVFSIYRIGDIGLLMAMWASHTLWHTNISFLKLNNYNLVHHQLQGHSNLGIFIGLMLLFAAAAKSAQFPFSSWLPRAMEGPTPSSAIFYGSLSVHFGVFLLLRTFQFWENQMIVRILIGVVGVVSFLLAYSCSRAQSGIKGKIAYASIAQIGIIFTEVAFGFLYLALVHIVLNALFRTFQLLTSPSAVNYKIREQFFYHSKVKVKPLFISEQLYYTWINLSINEFYLDQLLNQWIFTPIKRFGQIMKIVNRKNIIWIVFPLVLLAVGTVVYQSYLTSYVLSFLPTLYALFAFVTVCRAFAERENPILIWEASIISTVWIAMATSFHHHYNGNHMAIYFSGIVVFGALGYFVLRSLLQKEPRHFNLYTHQGHVFEYRTMAFVFLICTLGLMGSPISPTFIGEDLIYSHIGADQPVFALLNASTYIVGGIALMRLYSRLFLGPHNKTYHPIPYKNA
jgi:NADH:ubiquinone oxidoreductase subunit 5 (subunit L)/multisubunit Na+/H+ antiporter MnhA subunit